MDRSPAMGTGGFFPLLCPRVQEEALAAAGAAAAANEEDGEETPGPEAAAAVAEAKVRYLPMGAR